MHYVDQKLLRTWEGILFVKDPGLLKVFKKIEIIYIGKYWIL